MIIDTSILLGYVLKNHETLYLKALEIFTNHDIICLNEIVYEAFHVLHKLYSIPRNEVIEILLSLFTEAIVSNENPVLTIKALQIMRETSMDFVDCLLLAYRINHHVDIISFDKKVKNYLNRMQL